MLLNVGWGKEEKGSVGPVGNQLVLRVTDDLQVVLFRKGCEYVAFLFVAKREESKEGVASIRSSGHLRKCGKESSVPRAGKQK